MPLHGCSSQRAVDQMLCKCASLRADCSAAVAGGGLLGHSLRSENQLGIHLGRTYSNCQPIHNMIRQIGVVPS